MGSGRLCGEILNLSAGKNQTPTTIGTLTTPGCPRVEMGLGVHGLRDILIIDSAEEQRDLGIVDRLTKTEHFIAMRNTWTLD